MGEGGGGGGVDENGVSRGMCFEDSTRGRG